MPLYEELFIQFYNGSLLKRDSSIFQILFGFVSFVLSIVSLIGLNGFLAINWLVYVIFFVPLVTITIDSLFTYKKDKFEICKVYDSSYEELKDILTEYEDKINYKSE